jgi:hypothetical protein
MISVLMGNVEWEEANGIGQQGCRFPCAPVDRHVERSRSLLWSIPAVNKQFMSGGKLGVYAYRV